MKRLSIYYYNNEYGWVGDYVPFYLNRLKEFSEDIYVVTNNNLKEDAQKKLQECSNLIADENIVSELDAYRYAIKILGYEKIQEYDELILSNYSCYGPIYPLSELFEKMSNTECDFWGLNKFTESKDENFQKMKSDLKISKDLEICFLVFKNSILKECLFEKYWDEISTFSEQECIEYFEQQTFSFSSYMDCEKYSKYEFDPSIYNADLQNIEDKNPIVNRNLFTSENRIWLCNYIGQTAKDVFEYIDTNTEYDIGLIWQDLIKNVKMSVLRNNLHLNYYLSKKEPHKENHSKVALVLFVYYKDLIDYCINYIKSMPDGCDIYVISAKDEMLKAYENATVNLNYNFIYRKMENVGRDVSAYLVAAADVYEKYDYICCVHDKKSKHLPLKTGEDFSYHCFENCLASKDYVKNLITTFEENPYLGMLVPPMINFGIFLLILENSTCTCQKPMLELYDFLNLEIPFDKYPEAPLGTMFWVRGAAFKSVFNHKWEYADFPEEPLPLDGTLLHALERVYPLCVQNDGYYVGWVATADYVNVYSDNMFFNIKEINKIIYSAGYRGLCSFITQPPQKEEMIRVHSKFICKWLVQKFLYVFSFGKTKENLKKYLDERHIYIKE